MMETKDFFFFLLILVEWIGSENLQAFYNYEN